MAQDHAAPEEGEQAVVPGDDSNKDPTPPLPADQEDRRDPESPGQFLAAHEEPEIASERDIPSDGADALGEVMIKTLTPAARPSARQQLEEIKHI